MTRADMAAVRGQFVRAAEMAECAGFDMLELHYAHGYLMSAFITPLTNRRTGVAPRHVRQDPGLIDEHQARRIYRGHVVAVDLAFRRDIRSLLFARP